MCQLCTSTLIPLSLGVHTHVNKEFILDAPTESQL